MILAAINKFRRDRRGATAVMVALMMVPMIIASGAAVDFSRVSSARAQLQEAADAAALAGLGTYQNAGSQNVTSGGTLANANTAISVANSTFAAGIINLANYLTIGAPAVADGCADPVKVDGNAKCGPSAPASQTIACQNAGYCVQVQAQGVLKTSLLGVVIPNLTISVTALATTPLLKNKVAPKNAAGSTVANAYDENAIYAYGVPMDKNGVPQFTTLPDPTTSCSGPVANGALTQQIHGYSTVPSGTCPYLQIGDSKGSTIAANQPDLELPGVQPVAFLFVNVTGKYTAYSWKKQPDRGYCPDFTLYGSISQEGKNAKGDPVVPVQDSTNIYSSAYEMAGQPPSYNANHQISGFTVPAGTGGNTSPEQCPYYAYHNAQTLENNEPPWNATFFPNIPYPAGVTSVPSVVSGCTPNGSATPWNYSASNIRSGYCGAQQTGNFSNCALLIQDLGTGQTAVPNSYTESPNTADPQTLVANYATPLSPGTSTPGYPPDNTAHRCYDPASGFVPATSSTAAYFDTSHDKGVYDLPPSASSGYYDAIENPGLGAVYCGNDTPEVYALYWNDLGSDEADDLGYWNAITLFTCSVPSAVNISSGTATLSG